MPASAGNPITKVVSMISKLQQDVISEGEESQKMYNEFSEMCSDRSRELHHEIKVGKGKFAQLVATIEKATADIKALEERISDVAGETSEAEADLKKATAIRARESAGFTKEQKELAKTISTIERAVAIIEREGPKASLVQVEKMHSVTEVLRKMVEASTVDSYDSEMLAALVQSSSKTQASGGFGVASESSEDSASLAYKGHSNVLVETLEGLLDKAQLQLEEARKAETKAKHAYDMMKQSLTDKVKTLEKEMGEAKKSSAQTKEAKATASGDLETTKKDIAEDIKDRGTLHHDCLDKASTFEDSTSSRGDELKALAQAKKIILESSGGATEQTYDLAQTSLLQVDSAESAISLNSASDALHVVRQLASNVRSEALIELSDRMSQAIRRSSVTGAAPFTKVKGLLNSMVAKLQAEAEGDATKNAYCVKELATTKNSNENKEDDIEKLNTKVDVMESASKKLKGEVADLNKELASLAKTQGEMDKMRNKEKAVYKKNKPVMEQGLEGIKAALKVLREYYAVGTKKSHSASGSSSGIIGMLEVVESDFDKGLSEITEEEDSSASEHAKLSKENSVDKVMKEQIVRHKSAQRASLDKSISETKSDRSGVKQELSAVKEYFKSIKKECIAKPDSYKERFERRRRTVAGLEEALETLQGADAFVQQSTSHKTLRGSVRLATNE